MLTSQVSDIRSGKHLLHVLVGFLVLAAGFLFGEEFVVEVGDFAFELRHAFSVVLTAARHLEARVHLHLQLLLNNSQLLLRVLTTFRFDVELALRLCATLMNASACFKHDLFARFETLRHLFDVMLEDGEVSFELHSFATQRRLFVCHSIELALQRPGRGRQCADVTASKENGGSTHRHLSSICCFEKLSLFSCSSRRCSFSTTSRLGCNKSSKCSCKLFCLFTEK